MPLAAERADALRVLRVSRETEARLDAYADLLRRWQAVKNLVAPSTINELWTRHFLDSGQLHLLFPTARTWVDLGSGAGFPGLIIAILKAEEPGARVHLIESNQRKAAFLREAIRVTQVPAVVHVSRIEDCIAMLPGPVDMITARALAPLSTLLDLSAPLLTTGAGCAFLKGQDVVGELTQAAKSWRIETNLIPSLTDPEARVVHVLKAERRPSGSD